MDTIEQLNLDIASTRAAIDQAKKNSTDLDRLLIQQKELTEAKYVAANAFVKEDREVKELERFTVTSIFASLSGNKTERLEKETREADAAKVRYEMACREVEHVTARIADLRNQEANILALEDRLEELLAEKSALLRAEKIAGSAELTALEEQIAKLRNRGREIEDAQRAGNAVIGAIFKMESNLESARSAGALDMAGGSVWMGLSKQDHIEHAQKAAQEIQQAIANFRNELADVSVDVNAPSIEVGDFLSLADILFDNIFVDYAVQKKINKALTEIAPLRTAIEQAIAPLNALAQENNDKIASLEHKREIILNGHSEG